MFPIKATVTIGTHAELERFTAFITANTDANLKSAPKLETTKDAAAPAGKPKDAAAPVQTARSKPTATAEGGVAAAASTTKPEPQSSTETPVAANSAPARADVSKAAVALALKDKSKIVEILAKFGAKGVKDVPDDKLAEVSPLINAALEG